MTLTPERVALLLDSRAKSLPNSAYKLATSTYGLDVGIQTTLECDEKGMSIVIPFADGSQRDGVGDLLEVGGIRLDRHRKNPLVLFDHAKTVSLPIGMALERDQQGKYDINKYTVVLDQAAQRATLKAYLYQGKGLAGLDKQRDYDHSVFTEQVFDMACKGLLRGGSIGYQVIHAKELYPDYETGVPKGLHLLSVLMLEGSLVVLPANADTVAKMLSMPESCGKPLSPYLIKSLAPYASVKKAQLGYEVKAAKSRREEVSKGRAVEVEQVEGGYQGTAYRKIGREWMVAGVTSVYPKEDGARRGAMDLASRAKGLLPGVNTQHYHNIPPVTWKPGLGALKALRLKYGKKGWKADDRRQARETFERLLDRFRTGAAGEAHMVDILADYGLMSGMKPTEVIRQMTGAGIGPDSAAAAVLHSRAKPIKSLEGAGKQAMRPEEEKYRSLETGDAVKGLPNQGGKAVGEEAKIKVETILIGGTTYYTAGLFTNGGRSNVWTGSKQDSRREALQEAREYAREWDYVVKSLIPGDLGFWREEQAEAEHQKKIKALRSKYKALASGTNGAKAMPEGPYHSPYADKPHYLIQVPRQGQTVFAVVPDGVQPAAADRLFPSRREALAWLRENGFQKKSPTLRSGSEDKGFGQTPSSSSLRNYSVGDTVFARGVLTTLEAGKTVPFARTGDKLEITGREGPQWMVTNSRGQYAYVGSSEIRKSLAMDAKSGSPQGKQTLSNGKLTYEFNFKGGGGVNFRKLNANGFVLLTGAYTAEQAEALIDRLRGEGYAEKTLPSQGTKSLPLEDIRRKYRAAKGLRRRLKCSSPGTSTLRIREEDLEKCQSMAEARGLKFAHLGGGKVKLIGDDAGVDEVAKHFGVRG